MFCNSCLCLTKDLEELTLGFLVVLEVHILALLGLPSQIAKTLKPVNR